ncbi:MAG: fatty acid desaturase, partial [Bdellovibrionia bacterium]
TVELNPLLRFFLFPLNTNYHYEHHLAPAIPHYKLPAYSKTLNDLPAKSRQSLSDTLGELFNA